MELPSANGVAFGKWSCLRQMELPSANEVAFGKWSCLRQMKCFAMKLRFAQTELSRQLGALKYC